MTAPTHIAVFFDGEHENDRRALDPAYKANRPDFEGIPEEELPFSQLPLIQASLDLLGILYQETEACEVDDWIAAYVKVFEKSATIGCAAIDRIIISSFDSDYFQLISERVSILRYRGKASTIVDPDELERLYGILPSQYADFKSLVGDSADNIRGVCGIGPKTAAKLLREYGSLDQLLENLDTLTPERIARALKDAHDRLTLNRRLITLVGDMPLPIPIDALACPLTDYRTNELLNRLGIL